MGDTRSAARDLEPGRRQRRKAAAAPPVAAPPKQPKQRQGRQQRSSVCAVGNTQRALACSMMGVLSISPADARVMEARYISSRRALQQAWEEGPVARKGSARHPPPLLKANRPVTR